MWLPRVRPAGTTNRYRELKDRWRPASSPFTIESTLTQTESSPSVSDARTVPDTVSALLALRVVSSSVNESCGGPGRWRSLRQAAAPAEHSRISAPEIWQNVFREMRSVLPSCLESRPTGRSDSLQGATLHRDSSRGPDPPPPMRAGQPADPSRGYPAASSRILIRGRRQARPC